MTTIYIYEAHGQITFMHSDSENVNSSLSQSLSAPRTFTYPTLSSATTLKVYRDYLGYLQRHATTPPVQPHHLYLHQAAAAIRNSLISTKSHPKAPDELLRNSIFRTIPRPFGATALVVQHIDKRKEQYYRLH
jgi:hypothetical protein